ncbi:MAG: hypothetical protein AB1758_23635 [Candidatus Eremiobacterota bacterium]
MNNEFLAGVRTAVRQLALTAMVGAILVGGVACSGGGGGTTTPTPAAASPGGTTSKGTEGASEVVDITDTTTAASPTPSEAATPAPLPRPVAMDLERDPFENPMLGGGGSKPQPRVRPTGRPGASSGTGSKPAASTKPSAPGKGAAAEVEEEEVPAPDVTVTGIVSGGGKYRAIVNGPEQSYIVSVGDKLAEYRITTISPKAVTFTYKGKSFKVKLQDEFAGQK